MKLAQLCWPQKSRQDKKKTFYLNTHVSYYFKTSLELLQEKIHARPKNECQYHERQNGWEEFSNLKKRLEKHDNQQQYAISEWILKFKKLWKTFFETLEKYK